MKGSWLILTLAACLPAFGNEVIPPAPTRYFNDYAHVTSAATAERLNQTLEDFERQSSDQILVAIFPKMQSDSSVEDYTVRVARAWKAGQKTRNNGAVLFVFVEDHKMYLQVGYGLEGALPDALCKRIIDEQIAPRFKAGDFDGGLTAGVQGIIAAVKGEYQGTGKTVAESRQFTNFGGGLWIVLLIGAVILALLMASRRRRGIGRFGRPHPMWGGWTIGSGGSSGSSGWGGWGGGGGGFSGGGGSFGGGGAGGGW